MQKRKSRGHKISHCSESGKPSDFLLSAFCVLLSAFCFLLSGKLACAGSYASSVASAWGQPVVGIRLESDARLNVEDFATQITQKVGEPLDQSKVAQSLKNLFATGRFRELRADVEEKQNGVILVFVARSTFFVSVVRAERTPKPLQPSALISASRLRLGQPLSDEDLVAASQRIKTVLAENGYYQAQIEHAVLHDLDNQLANIVFSIVPGRRARLSGVKFQGHPGIPPQRLAAIAHWRPGVHLTSAGLERGLIRIHKFYVKQGRLQTTTRIQDRTYDPKHSTETLVVQVEAGPVVEVHLRGAHISSRQLKKLLLVYKEGVTDDLALAEGERKLRDYFEKQGYFSASVKWLRDPQPDSQKVEITYMVNLGARGDFAGLAYKGNRSVSEDDLNAILAIQPRDFPRVRGIFSHDLLQHDLKALKALYQSKGFVDVRVTPRLNDHYQNRSGNLFATFDIEEGTRMTVGRLTIQGVNADMEKKIRTFLSTNPGQPYSPGRADADRDAILDYFANQGYNHAIVTWKSLSVSATHQVDLEYQIEPGLQEKIRRVVLMGNQHTRAGIIRRELTFKRDQPLSQSALLESQTRLYDLDVFNQVQIAPQDPENSEPHKTVLVSMEEARRWTVGYGGGIDVQRLESSQPQGQYKASPRLSFDLTRLNVGGRAQTFSLGGRLSNLESGGTASYLIPRFLTHRDLSLRVNGLGERTRDVSTFTARRQEASVILQKRYSASTSLSGRYSFRRVSVDLSNRIDPQSIPLLSQPVRVATLGSTYVNDHRDNPADATKGSFSLADAGIAWQRLGSEANFLRLSGQNSTYYRLRPHLIFARNTRLGVESTFGGLREVFIPPAGDQPGHLALTRAIPLPERFFMGGSDAHRGFSLNQAGPRDSKTGFPIGGQALFLNTLELRLPLEENRYGLVLFHDAGNVFSSLRRARLLKFTQGSPTNFDYTVHAVGLGLRYQTPIGPLRFDVGYSLNPPRFQVCTQPQFQVCPPQDLEVRRLPKIQFFLSVGQSF